MKKGTKVVSVEGGVKGIVIEEDRYVYSVMFENEESWNYRKEDNIWAGFDRDTEIDWIERNKMWRKQVRLLEEDNQEEIIELFLDNEGEYEED
jgi:hypothetical protein